MQYKQYKLDTWCKKAKVTMIENDLTTRDVSEHTGYSRSHVTNTLNGLLRSQTARDKISDYLGINHYYDDN